MGIYNAFRHRQAEACARSTFRSEEYLEYFSGLVGTYSDPVVCDGNDQIFLGLVEVWL